MHAIFHRLLIGVRVCRYARIVRAQKLLALPDGFRQLAFHTAHQAVFVGRNVARARKLRQNFTAIFQESVVQFFAALHFDFADFSTSAQIARYIAIAGRNYGPTVKNRRLLRS